MKELSIEEKAKAYDNLIKRLKNFQSKYRFKTIEESFPELKESKDEKIKEGLINYFNNFHLQTFAGLNPKNILAWLEKQGERKPDDKVEPNFHFKVGQWIVATGKCVYLITKIDGFNVTLVDTNCDEYVFDASSLDDAHEWTIADAKAGDVLAVTMYPEGTWIGIFKEHDGCTFSSYCFVNTEGTFKLGTYNHGYGRAIHPATKEQRDLLFKKMKEAGYEWDAEKKELKKIHNAFEECEIVHVEHGKYYYCIKDYYAGGNKRASKGDVVQALNGMNMMALGAKANEYFIPVNTIKQMSTWSEEDGEIHRRCICAMRASACGFPEEEKFVEQVDNWLKSLKERYTWKPNDEQIKALEHFVRSVGESGYASPYDNDTKLIYSLLEQLKQL